MWLLTTWRSLMESVLVSKVEPLLLPCVAATKAVNIDGTLRLPLFFPCHQRYSSTQLHMPPFRLANQSHILIFSSSLNCFLNLICGCGPMWYTGWHNPYIVTQPSWHNWSKTIIVTGASSSLGVRGFAAIHLLKFYIVKWRVQPHLWFTATLSFLFSLLPCSDFAHVCSIIIKLLRYFHH